MLALRWAIVALWATCYKNCQCVVWIIVTAVYIVFA